MPIAFYASLVFPFTRVFFIKNWIILTWNQEVCPFLWSNQQIVDQYSSRQCVWWCFLKGGEFKFEKYSINFKCPNTIFYCPCFVNNMILNFYRIPVLGVYTRTQYYGLYMNILVTTPLMLYLWRKSILYLKEQVFYFSFLM